MPIKQTRFTGSYPFVVRFLPLLGQGFSPRAWRDCDLSVTEDCRLLTRSLREFHLPLLFFLLPGQVALALYPYPERLSIGNEF